MVIVATSSFAHAAPNIIWIMADDLGYGDLGCYGQKHIKTPNIDRLAAEGMKFTQFYAGSTVCAPSRCVLMTGLHLGRCFIRGNGKDNLRPQDVTVAEVLKKAGYATGLIGKWGLGHEGSTGVPTKQGFDYFFGYLDQHHAHNYYPEFLVRNEQRVPLRNKVNAIGPYGGGVAYEKVDYSAKFMLDETLAFLDRTADKPFFLYLAYTLPHANNEANRELGNGAEVPDLGIYKDLDWTEQNKGQAAMIGYLDMTVGKVMARLKSLGIDENTLVIFTSDNGPHQESGNDPEFFDANGPVRGLKRDLTDGGIRVPFIARWPGKIKAGSTSDHVGYFGDLMATAAELAGVEPPADLDSISFVPAMLGQNDKQKQHEFLYWEFYERGSKQAVRFGDWKAIREPMFDGEIELYNVARDIGEARDVAAEYPELVSKARMMMEKAHVPSARWKPSGKAPAKKSSTSKKKKAA